MIYVTTWMNLEDIILSEMNQAQKEVHCMVPSKIEKIMGKKIDGKV